MASPWVDGLFAADLWLRDLGTWHSLTGNFEGITLDGALLRSCADRRNGLRRAAEPVLV